MATGTPMMRSFPSGDAKEGETAPRRNYTLGQPPNQQPLTTTPGPEVVTVLDILRSAAQRFPNNQAFGQRKLRGMVTEKKVIKKIHAGKTVESEKTWSYFDLSPHSWHTYADALHHVSLVGSGLNKLGFVKSDYLMIFAATCRDWMEGAHGAFWAGGGIVTAYDTLGPSGLSFSLQETESRFMLTHPELLVTVASIQAQTPKLKFVFLTPSPLSNAPADSAALAKLEAAGVKVMTIEELKIHGGGVPQGERMGGEPLLKEPVPSTREDTACIMYTSGSTGNPKGVTIPHKMCVAGISSAQHLIGRNMAPGQNFFLAYLPLAHILEFTAEQALMYNGVALGYGTPKTLTDASVRNCNGDILELRPHMMVGVPMVWDTVMKGIRDRIEAMSPMQKKIFWWAFENKWWCLERGLPTFFFDWLVFNKIKERVGGRLLWALSGGALLSKTTQKFLYVCICPTIQGYGLTETNAVTCVQDPKHVTLGIAGEIMPAVEMKLVDVPEANYFVKNQPNPQGEVWVRGLSVMPGYFKNPGLTAEVKNDDGWFMTGDIGEFLPDGTVQIIDRRKNLVKLAHGEYVALEKLESLYKLSKYVANMILHADILQNFVVALVLPNEAHLRTAAEEQGLVPKGADATLDQLVEKPELRSVVMDSFKAIAKEQGLKGSDIVGNLRLVSGEWSPQSGLLTSAQKVKRPVILNKYSSFVEEMYEEGRV